MQSKIDVQKQTVLQYLRDFEQKYKIRFVFVCESGSRSHQTSTANSDHDLKGVYLPEDNEKAALVHRTTNTSWKGLKSKLDYEFIPLEKFFEQIAQDNCVYLRWATSTFTYIDQLQGMLQATIQQNFNFPVGEVEDRIKKDIAKAQVEGTRQAKKLLNMLVDSLLVVYHKLVNSFAPMALGKLLEYLNSRQDVFTGVDEIADLAHEIMLMKKNGKGLTPIEVPLKAMDLARLALSLPLPMPRKTKDQMLSAIAILRKQIK